MDDIYVIIGGSLQQSEAKKGPEPVVGVLEYILPPKNIDEDYSSLLKNCLEIGRESYNELSGDAVNVYSLLERAVKDGQAGAFDVYVFNRQENEGKVVPLSENVRQSAGDSMYVSSQIADDDIQEFKTLELYVLEEKTGGN